MASAAWIWNPELIGEGWRDEAEGVAAYEIITERNGDFRHMAGGAFAAGAAFFVVRVFRNRRVRPGWRLRRMAGNTKLISNRSQVRRVLVAVDLMTIKAAHLAVIHHALRKIVALHAILVRA